MAKRQKRRSAKTSKSEQSNASQDGATPGILQPANKAQPTAEAEPKPTHPPRREAVAFELVVSGDEAEKWIAQANSDGRPIQVIDGPTQLRITLANPVKAIYSVAELDRLGQAALAIARILRNPQPDQAFDCMMLIEFFEQIERKRNPLCLPFPNRNPAEMWTCIALGSTACIAINQVWEAVDDLYVLWKWEPLPSLRPPWCFTSDENSLIRSRTEAPPPSQSLMKKFETAGSLLQTAALSPAKPNPALIEAIREAQERTGDADAPLELAAGNTKRGAGRPLVIGNVHRALLFFLAEHADEAFSILALEGAQLGDGTQLPTRNTIGPRLNDLIDDGLAKRTKDGNSITDAGLARAKTLSVAALGPQGKDCANDVHGLS